MSVMSALCKLGITSWVQWAPQYSFAAFHGWYDPAVYCEPPNLDNYSVFFPRMIKPRPHCSELLVVLALVWHWHWHVTFVTFCGHVMLIWACYVGCWLRSPHGGRRSVQGTSHRGYCTSHLLSLSLSLVCKVSSNPIPCHVISRYNTVQDKTPLFFPPFPSPVSRLISSRAVSFHDTWHDMT